MTRRRHLPVLLSLLVSGAAFYALLFGTESSPHPPASARRAAQEHSIQAPILRALPVEPVSRVGIAQDKPLKRVRGRVLSVIDRAPVKGASVFLAAAREHALVRADSAVRTDSAGEFSLELETLQKATLWVTASGYLPWQGAADEAAEHVQILLDPGVTLDGVVVDLSGSPVQGVHVSCAPSRQRLGWPHDSRFYSTLGSAGGVGASGSDGRFSITGLAPDTAYEVHARKHGWVRSGQFVPTAFKPGFRDLRVVMRREAGLRVRIQAEDGSPLTEEATTILTPPDGWGWSSSLERQVDSRLRRETTLPSDDGWITYRLSQTAPPGDDAVPEVEIEATAPGYAVVIARTAISPESDAESVLSLTELDPGRRLVPVSFRAHLPTGEPLRGGFTAVIRTAAGEHWSSAMVFDDTGSAARVRKLPPGRSAIRIGPGLGIENDQFWPVAEWFEFDVAAAGPVGTVEVPCRGNPLKLRVTTADGAVVRGYDLRVRSDVGPKRVGNWRFVRDLPMGPDADPPVLFLTQGRTSLELSLSDVGGAEVSVEASGDGSELTLEIQLEKGKEVPWRAIFERHEAR